MKKMTIWALSLAFLMLGTTACSENQAPVETTPETTSNTATVVPADSTSSADMAAVTYTCPMHPEIRKSAAGQCPKCHMDLVKEEK